MGVTASLRATRGAIRDSVRGLLHKEKAADVSGHKRLAGDIGVLDRNRALTRRGAEFRPLAIIVYHNLSEFVSRTDPRGISQNRR